MTTIKVDIRTSSHPEAPIYASAANPANPLGGALHHLGTKETAHAWVKRLQDCADRLGYMVELVDNTR